MTNDAKALRLLINNEKIFVELVGTYIYMYIHI